MDGLLDEAARFFEQVVAPTNRDGDTVGSQRNDDGSVTAAPGLAKAYRQHVAAGWNGVAIPAEHGGGGFPWLLGIAVQEMLASANMGYSLCPLLSQAAIDALLHHGSESQRETYLPKMVTGEWSGTMDLTEPQAGSDVGALTSKAQPDSDGTWRITGQKIFITWGEHGHGGQHHPYGARSYHGCACGHERYQLVHRPEISWSTMTVRSASATMSIACLLSTSWESTRAQPA